MANEISRRSLIKKGILLGVLQAAGLQSLMAIGKSPNFFVNENVSDFEKIQQLLQSKQPAKWIFNGDSITQGAKHTHNIRSYPEVIAERIRFELGRYEDIIINTAISSNTTQNILNEFDWRVAQFKPQVVSLMIGTNDASVKKEISLEKYYKNLEEIIHKIRKLKAIPILQTPNIIITEDSPDRATLPIYVEKMQQYAKEQDIVLVDNYKYWNTLVKETSRADVFKRLMNDNLHPNGAGHLEIAREFFRTLNIFNAKDATCGGPEYEGKH
ncbi:MAG: SGNH/GDSL hydrolase family protein [Ginsengibacter sp.]